MHLSIFSTIRLYRFRDVLHRSRCFRSSSLGNMTTRTMSTNQKLDAVIVGSGPVGCTFARKLLEAGKKVVMLEAGPSVTGPPGSHIMNSFRYRRLINSFNNIKNSYSNAISNHLQTISVPTTNHYIYPDTIDQTAELRNGTKDLNRNPEQEAKYNLSAKTTAYCVGGMGTIWTCVTPRLSGSERFPDLIPDVEMNNLYEEAEKFLQTKPDPYQGTMFQTIVLESFKKYYSEVKALPVAITRYDKYTGDTFWTGSYDILGDENYPKLILKDNHLATNLVLSNDGSRIEKLRVRNLLNDKEEDPIISKLFIVCGGAVLTPQLLHNSSLNTLLPSLGKNLYEQSLAACQIILKNDIIEEMLKDERWREEVQEHKKKYPNDPVPIPFNTPFPMFWFPYDDRRPWHIQTTHCGPLGLGINGGDILDDRVILDFQCFGRTHQDNENRVEFSDKYKDMYGMPQPTFYVKVSNEDSDNNRKMMDYMTRAALSIGCFFPGSEPRFMAPGSALHITGTVRMGTDKDNSVVDKNLRVHGLNNLFLGSNGVIPTATAGNPTLTSVALAIKSADYIIEELEKDRQNVLEDVCNRRTYKDE